MGGIACLLAPCGGPLVRRGASKVASGRGCFAAPLNLGAKVARHLHLARVDSAAGVAALPPYQSAKKRCLSVHGQV